MCHVFFGKLDRFVFETKISNIISFLFFRLKGIGPKCPYYLDPSKNEMTGRKIEDPELIGYILTLHNEVRSVAFYP